MTKLSWDNTGQRRYETGVDRGVLYLPDSGGVYATGVAWNGLETVTESPTGADATPTYADNIKYLNLISLEQFGCTIEAYTYPDEWAACDGSSVPSSGVTLGQQPRRTFGLSYRTRVGNDTEGTDHGYKLHLVYGCFAAPSQKAFATINDSPEAISFSWDVTTTPVNVDGNDPITGKPYKPTASMTIDSTVVDPTALAALEDMLYGTVGADPQLPLPTDVIALFDGTITSVFPTPPTYDNSTHHLTIPSTTGVIYSIDGVDQTAGVLTITEDTVVFMRPDTGYVFTQPSVNTFFANFS
jgi:hypothetical protein